MFLNKTETKQPSLVYSEFLKREYGTLVFILYGWTFVVLLVVFAVGVVVGDIIFSYFSLIRKKCKQYLQSPEQIRQIEAEMKTLFKHESNRFLFESIVSIMQGIENKKKENRRNYRINYDVYPLNRLGMGFQNRMHLQDYHRLEALAAIIKEREHDIK